MPKTETKDPAPGVVGTGSVKTAGLGITTEAYPNTPPAGSQAGTATDQHRRAVAAALRAMPTSELMIAKERWPYGNLDAWFRLLDEWAELNGLDRIRQGFTLAHVARSTRNGRGGIENDAIFSRPERDHCSYFKCDERATALVSEPYQADIPRLRHALEQHGLVVHVPPNPRASFWYPGHTLFLVITRSDTKIDWLPYQIDFKLGGENE